MIKKIKYLVLASVVAGSMIGAGYALWTQNLVVKADVSTAKFDVKMETGTISQLSYMTNTVTIKDLGHAADVSINNMYPDAVVNVSIPVTNLSSIPVKASANNFIATIQAALPVGVTISDVTYPENLGVAGLGDIKFTLKADDTMAKTGLSFNFTIDPTYTQNP